MSGRFLKVRTLKTCNLIWILAFVENPSEKSSPQSDSNDPRSSRQRICAGGSAYSRLRPFGWTNNLVHPWDVDWSEWVDKTNEFLLKSLVRSTKRTTNPEFDECHSLSGFSGDTCHLCDELRVDEIPDNLLQTW